MRKRPGQFDIRGERERERKRNKRRLPPIRARRRAIGQSRRQIRPLVFRLPPSSPTPCNNFYQLPFPLLPPRSLCRQRRQMDHWKSPDNNEKSKPSINKTTWYYRRRLPFASITQKCCGRGKVSSHYCTYIYKVFRYSGPRSKMAGSHASQSLTPDAQRLYYI